MKSTNNLNEVRKLTKDINSMLSVFDIKIAYSKMLKEKIFQFTLLENMKYDYEFMLEVLSVLIEKYSISFFYRASLDCVEFENMPVDIEELTDIHFIIEVRTDNIKQM